MTTRLDALRGNMAAAACDAFVSLSPAANQYLTGFTGSTSAVLVTEDQALFLCDFRYTEQAGQEASGVAIEEVTGSFETAVGNRLDGLGAKTVAFDPETMTVAQRRRIEAAFAGSCRPAPDVIAPLRQVKSLDEIARIRAAVQLAEAVLADALSTLTNGVAEQELGGWFEFEFRKRGASGSAFDTIALFGARSSLVHGQPGARTLKRGDIVLLDFGCRLDGYCSDLTRTYAFGTMPGDWFEAAYDLTLTAQQRALEAVRPGMRCCDLDAVAREHIVESGHGDHFGHGLGHGVGIDVHEPPRLHKDSDTVLETGMVVTIEPGVYLPQRGGVRIEDLVVVTDDGCECLSSAPKELRVLGV